MWIRKLWMERPWTGIHKQSGRLGAVAAGRGVAGLRPRVLEGLSGFGIISPRVAGVRREQGRQGPSGSACCPTAGVS